MTKDLTAEFISHGATVMQILEGIDPSPEKGATTDFIARVMQLLPRVNEQIERLESMNAPAREYALAEKFKGRLAEALSALIEMGEGADTVIHQHLFMNQNTQLPLTKSSARPVKATLQALIGATKSYQDWDIDRSSKLNPKKRKYMPLLVHIGQAWEASFWPNQQDAERKTPPINANENSVFFQFTNFLIVEIIGDPHHRNESLIRTALREGLLPK